MSDGQCCINFVRLLVIIFNSIFAVCGLLLVAVSIWMLVDDNVSEIIDLSSYASGSDLLRIAAILLIVIGTLLFIISLIGILGAVVENKVVLGIFMGFLIVIFLGEVVGFVLVIVFKDSLIDNLDDALLSSLQNYYEPGTCTRSATGDLWDDVQSTLECCGIKTIARGYEKLNDSCTEVKKLPDSCCDCEQSVTACHPARTCTTVWEEGCVKKVGDKIIYYAPVLIGIGIAVAMIEIIGIIFATCLCVNARDNK